VLLQLRHKGREIFRHLLGGDCVKDLAQRRLYRIEGEIWGVVRLIAIPLVSHEKTNP
jgi:hypothetical protein